MSASDVSSQPVAQPATATKTVHHLCQNGHPLKWVITKVKGVRFSADINTRKIDKIHLIVTLVTANFSNTRPGVNYVNILYTDFMCPDPKSVKGLTT